MTRLRFGAYFCVMVVLFSVWKYSASEVYAQQGCDYTIGTGEQYTTFESLNLHQTGTNLAGKVVCVRNNKTYGQVNILKSGTGDTQWLTIRSHPQNSGKPQFTSTTTSTVIDVKGRYVIVDGLEVTSAPNGDGIEVVDTDYVKLLNVKVSETKGHGIQVIGSSYVWIDYCNVRKAVMSTGSPVGENVRSSLSDHVWITNCLITEDGSVRGGVLNSGQSEYTYFKNNELHLNGSNNLHLGNGEHVVFENNLVSGGCSETGTGFYKQAERYPRWANSYVYKGNDIQIRNNLIVNMTKGIVIQGCQAQCIDGDTDESCTKQPWKPNEQCPFDNVVIENNTIVGTGVQNSGGDETKEYALQMVQQQNQPVENVRIRNNLFHSKSGDEKDLKNDMIGDLVFSGNIWSDVSPVPQGDTVISNWSNVFAGNPNLTDCSDDRKNPSLYQVSASYAGKGANVSLVGIGRGGDGRADPSPTPPASVPPFDYDYNDDGNVNVADVRLLIARMVQQLVTAFDSDNNGRINSLDFAGIRKMVSDPNPTPYPSPSTSPRATPRTSPSASPSSSPRVSPSSSPVAGSLLVFSSATDPEDLNTKEIYTVRPNGTELTRLTNNSFDDEGAMLSPDRSKIAFKTNRDGNFEIYVMNVNGTNVQRLTNNSGHDQGVSWSPDGTRLAFGSDRDGDYDIYTMNSSNGGNIVQLTTNSLRDRTASWSPLGDRIAFTCSRGGDLDVCSINASDGSNEVILTNSNSGEDAIASWHPTGTKIAYRRGNAGSYDIWVMNSNGTNPQNLSSHAGDDMGPTWSPDGTKIAFSSMRDGNSEIYVMDADGSNQTKVINLPNTSEDDIDWR